MAAVPGKKAAKVKEIAHLTVRDERPQKIRTVA